MKEPHGKGEVQNWWEFSKIFVCIFFGTAILSLPEGTWKKLNFDKTDCFWNALKDLGPIFHEMVHIQKQSPLSISI